MLVSIGVLFGVVLGALAYAFSVVKEDAPYTFMQDANQDGFQAYVAGWGAEVSRFYTVDKDVDEVVGEAHLELTAEQGWSVQQGIASNGEIWIFTVGAVNSRWRPASFTSVVIEPLQGSSSTSVTVHTNATKAEEIIGTKFKSIPDRYADMR